MDQSSKKVKMAFSTLLSASCSYFVFPSIFLKKFESKYSGWILLFSSVLCCGYYIQSLIISLWKKYTISVLQDCMFCKRSSLQKFTAVVYLDKKGNPFNLSSEEQMEVQKIILAS